jgi:hypothetical protein
LLSSSRQENLLMADLNSGIGVVFGWQSEPERLSDFGSGEIIDRGQFGDRPHSNIL